MLAWRVTRGFTLIELLIGLAIMGLLLMLGLPAFSTFLQNTQIRNAAETSASGLQLARNEALRRNTSVRFQYVDSLDNSCNVQAGAINWVVSRNDVAANCGQTEVTDFVNPNDVTQPQIVQKKSGAEGAANVAVTPVDSAAAPVASVIFNSLGRVASGGIAQIDFSNPGRGVCQHVDATNGTMRCLRILVSSGGRVKVCDPKVTDTTDARYCQ